jgi:imipenem/basic amino acid-specific outer membrane pore
MKFAKLSLAAIMAMGISAFADVQNIKVSGDAKLFYATNDANDVDLFDKDGTAGQAAVDVAVSADLANGVAGKMGVTMLNTLGLENNLVSAVWDAGLSNQWWVNEAWLAKTFGKTTFKVGRQELDTPLAFTETWSIAKNTFDAAVVLNQDIQDTTLVGAWVGRGNGTSATPTIASPGSAVAPIASYAGVVNNAQNGNDPFGTYWTDGAYTVGVVTTAIPMTTAQAWYYDVVQVAQAFWLQADIALEDNLKGLTLGAQYATLDLDAANTDDGSVWAAKIGYAMDNGLSLSAAYSSEDESTAGAGWNTATGTGNSKLYTEAWWNYGYVTASDTDAWNVTVAYNMEDVADFAAYYTSSSNDTTNVDMNEFTLTAGKSFGNLNTTLAYIYTNADDQNNGDSYNTVQVYLTYNF